MKKGCIISRLVLGSLIPWRGRREGRNREVEREGEMGRGVDVDEGMRRTARRVSGPADGESKRSACVRVVPLPPSLHLANERHHNTTLTATPLRARGGMATVGGGGRVGEMQLERRVVRGRDNDPG